MKELLSLLNKNARLTNTQLAQLTNTSEQEIASELRELEKNGIINGYTALIDWEKVDKEYVTALIELKISPQKGIGFDEIARKVSEHHEVESVYLMSGGFDLAVIIRGKSMKEVSLFVSQELATMEGILSTGTHFVLKKYKEQGVEFGLSEKDERKVIISW